MTARARREDEEWGDYRLSLRTEERRLKRRLKGKYLFQHLLGDKDKKPYVAPEGSKRTTFSQQRKVIDYEKA